MTWEMNLAEKLFASGGRLETGASSLKTDVIVGRAVSDSENGFVEVEYEGNVTYGDIQANIVSTGPNVKAGDTVIIGLAGGVGKSPTVQNVPGWGDRIVLRVDELYATYVEVSNLVAQKANISDLTAATAKIETLEATALTADSAIITDLQAETAKLENVEANELTAATAYIETLETGNLTAQNLLIETAKVANVEAEEIEASVGYIGDLTSGNVTAQNIISDHGDFNTVKANAAKVQNLTAAELEADHATVNSLDSNYAHITNGVIDTATIGYASVNGLSANYAQIDLANVDNAWIEDGVIKDAAIVDAQILGVSANKLTAGTIDASNINVANLRADSLVVNRLNGQPVLGGYTAVNSNAIGYSSMNPSAQGWYEIANGQMVLSQDTAVDPGKAYYSTSQSVSLYDQTYIDGIENQLNQRIDGAIETYSGTAAPTLVNYPYTDWYDTTTSPVTDNRDEHIGDLYYVVNEAADENGYCYRFYYDQTSQQYMWVLIKDSDVTAALSDISELKTFETNTTSWINNTDDGLEQIRTNHTTLSGVVDKTVKTSVQLWFTKANTTAPGKPTSQVTNNNVTGANSYNKWNLAVPEWNSSYPNYFFCWQYELVDGTFDWSPVVRDVAMGETQGTSRSAQTTANSNIKSSVQLWFTKANSTKPNKPTTVVSVDNPATGNAWNLSVPTYSESYPHYFYCYQQQKGDGSYQWSDVVYDKGTTEAMAKAQAALPQSSFTTFEQNTFKTVSDKVDEQTTTIETLTTAVQYGGVNKLSNGEGVYDVTTSPYSNSTATEYDAEYDGVPAWYMSGQKYIRVDFPSLETDQIYTFSFEATRSNAQTVYVTIDGFTEDLGKTSSTAGEWKTFSTTFTATSTSTYALIQIYAATGTTNTYVAAVRHLKLEVGTFATPWEYSVGDVSTMSNTVNNVSQTATSNSSTISQLVTTLGTNADGTTKAGDIVHRTSAVEQDLGGFKTTVSQTYATQTDLATTNGNVTNAQTDATKALERQTAYSATCSIAAGTAAKVASCTNFPTLAAGATVTVRFSTANTSTGAITLNVNSTGAKTVYVNGAATSSTNQLLWGANANVTFTYDGSYWRVVSEPRTWYGTCGVAAATAAKTATINEAVICKGTVVTLNMTYENTNESATLNVASTGAKNIYYGTTTSRPTTTNGYGWAEASTVSFVFDGAYWRIGDTTSLKRVTNAESSITQTATSITSLVANNDTYTAPDGTTKTNTIKSAIKQNAAAIDLRVEKSGVIAAINASIEEEGGSAAKISADKVEIDGTVIFSSISSNVDSAITSKGYATTGQVATAKSEAISSANSTTDTKLASYSTTQQMNTAISTAVDNIDVGGRNLLKYTAKPVQNSTSWNRDQSVVEGWSRWSTYITCTNTDSGIKGELTADSVSGFVVPFVADNAVIGDVEYTLSFDYRTNLSSFGSVYLLCASGGNKTANANPITASDTDWQHYEQTLTWASTAGQITRGLLIPYSKGPDKWIEIRNRSMKLERGNVATDWTPAPEDLASASDSVEYIVGTQTAATNVWTGVTKDSAIYTGKKIAYYLPFAGNSSAATLNLTLSGGGTTGAKNVLWNNTNVTTHYPQYSVIQLVYDGTYWRTSAYNSDTMNRKRIENAVKIANANMTKYCIAGHITESTAANSGYKMVASGVAIDLQYPIAYLNQNTASGQSYAVAANGTTTNFYTAINSVSLTNTKSGWTGTQYAMCFLKGTVNGNKFTVHSDVFTTTAPTTDDGYVYIPVGMTYSTTQVNFDCDNSLYAYIDGKFRQVTTTEVVAEQDIYCQSDSILNVPSTPNGEWVTATAESVDEDVMLRANMLDGTPIAYNRAGYNVYDLLLSESLVVETEYVLHLFDVDVSHSAKSAADLGVMAYYNGGNICLGGWKGTDYFTDGHADMLSIVFTPHTSSNTTTSGGNVSSSNNLSHSTASTTPPFIRLYNSVPSVSGTMSMTVGSWHMAMGDAATSPAWTTKPPTFRSLYPVTFVAKQRKRLDGTIVCTAPVVDDTATVINGSNIVVGRIDASRVDVVNLNASNITTGTMSAEHITGGTLTVMQMSSELQGQIDKFDDDSTTLANLKSSHEALEGNVAAFTAQTTGVVQSHDGTLQMITNRMQFLEGKLILDASGDPNSTANKAVLTTDKLAFESNGAEVAYISNEKLYVTNAQVLDTMQMGGFAWIPRSNGNLSLKWVGGVSHMNLLRNTESIAASGLVLTRATVPSAGIIRLTPTTSAAYAKFKVDYLDYAQYGNGTYTFSFDARLADVSSSYTENNVLVYAGYNLSSRLTSTLSSSYDRYKGWTFSSSLTSSWQRYSGTFAVPTDLTTGKAEALAAGSYLTVQLAASGSKKPVEVRNVKLEIGTEATPWSKNPND